MPLGDSGPRNGVAMDEFMMMRRGGGGGLNGRDMGFDPLDSVDRRNREPLPLPPDASNTLYVEGLPSNCSRREVARILFHLSNQKLILLSPLLSFNPKSRHLSTFCRI